MDIFTVMTINEIDKKLKEVFPVPYEKTEIVSVPSALGRILSKSIHATMDVPHFSRSVVDGYAVRAKDTFGASESLPGFLTLVGTVEMGKPSLKSLKSGETIYVPTGGALPAGADAVIMIEYAEPFGQDQIAIHRPAGPLENMMSRGDDLSEGELVLKRGTRVRPQEVGVLASLGIMEIEVFSPISVTILSTGDEIVPIHQIPGLGQVRDINTYTLSAMVETTGAAVHHTEVLKDDFEILKNALTNALIDSDLVLLSGGSSVGDKDYTQRVMMSFPGAELLTHGLAVKPGKPTVVARIQGKPVFGLPGQPASAMTVFKAVVEPLIRRLMGQNFQEQAAVTGDETVGRLALWENAVIAYAGCNIHAAPGRTTFQMVSLDYQEGKRVAVPVHGKSGMISLMSRAHGFIRIEAEKEGILQGEMVHVILF